ncbi:hypothetical protein [Streptomyces pini]|uniref:Uncharacterized protein n=1 Tax=Streptomyces pini TaxID=1520580 RepID=A0A1I4DVX1_9ACTN|nr:hypothetical protein [Streptomyces pini]SFK97818.1 hypothetical protein SAMN05192584_11141 [Streptomyces pini]
MLSSLPRTLRTVGIALAAWTPLRWGAAAGGAALTALLVGLPAAVIPNPLFSRMTPTLWWNYPTLVATALLAGIVLATYVRAPGAPRASRSGSIGGVLSFLAVGCPVCNKFVLIALGTSGALSVWAPIQPFLALASVALLAVAAVKRLTGEIACRAPVQDAAPAA